MNTFAESISRVLCKMALPKDTYNSLPWLCFINRSRSTSCTPDCFQSLRLPPFCHRLYLAISLLHYVELTAFTLKNKSYNTVHYSKGDIISALFLHLTHFSQRVIWFIAITGHLMSQSSVKFLYSCLKPLVQLEPNLVAVEDWVENFYRENL